ncbi:MAG TPA: Gfo/Idh/MocA family oxidoreductase [Gaiellaceae bacterium]|nr:Gfo/Idh/MocA family oxidoreductase [Gaiellaceae bacterium]
MRFAAIGLGRATMLYHLPALRRVSGAEVVGGFDPVAERRAEWEKETSSPAFASLEELFERTNPDVVTVATPPESHAELCLQAIEAGSHVFCEKPFVESAAEADRIIEAAGTAGRVVAVNHEFRENPIFRAVRDGVSSGEYGRIVFCQVWQLMNLAPWDEPTPWRAGMANRTLFEGGVHLVDLLLSIYGASPTAVYARHSAGFHEQQDADAVHLLTLEFPEGRLAQITIDRLCPAGTRYLEVRADCERASLRASFGGRAVVQLGMKRAEKKGVKLDFGLGGIAWAERGLSRTKLASNPRDAAVIGTHRLLAGFVEAVERGSEPPSSAREARDVLAVIDAAYESHRTGERIELSQVPLQPVRQT